MTETRDPILQSLFVESQPDLDGEAFTRMVMAKTQRTHYRLVAVGLMVSLLTITSAWLLDFPLEIAQLLGEILTFSLVDLGNNWIAWLLSPINNIASLIILSFKAFRSGRRRILNATYAN